MVYLTRSGAVTRILDASPGKPSTPRPTGTFSIYRRIDGWRQSPLGLLWRPNYFYRGHTLHGVDLGADLRGQPRLCPGDHSRDGPGVAKRFIGERVYVYR